MNKTLSGYNNGCDYSGECLIAFMKSSAYNYTQIDNNKR